MCPYRLTAVNGYASEVGWLRRRQLVGDVGSIPIGGIIFPFDDDVWTSVQRLQEVQDEA